jgi:hypothetical protein
MNRKMFFSTLARRHGESTSLVEKRACLSYVVLDRIQRRVEHLLGVDARRIDVALADADEGAVDDLERPQVVLLLGDLAGSRRRPDLAVSHPQVDQPLRGRPRDRQDEGRESGGSDQEPVQAEPATHLTEYRRTLRGR